LLPRFRRAVQTQLRKLLTFHKSLLPRARATVIYIARMIFGWFKPRPKPRPSHALAGQWADDLGRDMPMFAKLPRRDQRTLIDIAFVIEQEKQWFSRGIDLTPAIKRCICGQAALLLLGMDDHDHYPNVSQIIVVACAWHAPSSDGVTLSHTPVAGTAHIAGGTVELAWNHALGGAMNIHDGHNVVFHEFAHKLDLLDGWADGTPPMKDRATFDHWVKVMTDHFELLTEQADAGRRTLLRRYGLTNPAEFFAVASEVFFEKSRKMQRDTPRLYEQLQRYYQQDPARW